MANPDTKYPNLECVWVSAGLLSHHLCEHDFDCDTCALHRALSPQAGRNGSDRAFWPKDRLYSPGHFWLKQESSHRAQVGLTEMAVQLLHPVCGWSVTLDQSSGAPAVCVQAHLPCGHVVLQPNIDTHEVLVNSCLEIDALWPAADPWLSGYLLEFSFESWPEASRGWLELTRVAPMYAHHRRIVDRFLRLECTTNHVSPPTADGGLPTSGLLTALGRPAYDAVVAEVLRCTIQRD